MTPPEPNVPVIQHCRHGGGQVLNVLGCKLTALTHCGKTRDAVFVSECAFPPGIGPPLHTHPQWESFYVIAGTVEFGFLEGGRTTTLVARPGDLVTIPSNAPHSFRNIGAQWANMLIISEPGLEAFFYDAGLGVPDGPPSDAEIERVVGVMRTYGQKVLGPHPGN